MLTSLEQALNNTRLYREITLINSDDKDVLALLRGREIEPFGISFDKFASQELYSQFGAIIMAPSKDKKTDTYLEHLSKGMEHLRSGCVMVALVTKAMYQENNDLFFGGRWHELQEGEGFWVYTKP